MTTEPSVPAAGRSIPGWLAPIVEHLELQAKRVVTLEDIRAGRPELTGPGVGRARDRLMTLGWLRPSGARGTYEFLPGAAAGPYPSGDPWLTLRAMLAEGVADVHVGGQSAAWLLGYAQRRPERHLLVGTPRTWWPQALRRTYRVLETRPAPAHGQVEGLPVPTAPELFAEMAQLAPRLSLDAAKPWVDALLGDVEPGPIAAALADRGPATRARAGYMSEKCGALEHAAAIARLGPIARGPYYTGRKREMAPFSPTWRVYDTGRFAP